VLLQLRASRSAQGVRDYLCNRMYSLNEERVEAYLSQLVAMALQNPSPALARLCVDLCARSARLACKVHWLLSAYAADERAVSREAFRALQTATEEAAAAKWGPPRELVAKHSRTTLTRARTRFSKGMANSAYPRFHRIRCWARWTWCSDSATHPPALLKPSPQPSGRCEVAALAWCNGSLTPVRRMRCAE